MTHDLERFERNLQRLRCLLQEPEPSRSFTLHSPPPGNPMEGRVARFADQLPLLQKLLDQPISAKHVPPPNAAAHTELDLAMLECLSESLVACHKRVQAEAESCLKSMRATWPDDPRLTRQSLFAPLGLRLKEVPLTNALAWLLDPAQGDSLHAASLAAVLGLIFRDSRFSAEDIRHWSVEAERQIECGPDESSGRIDIFVTGDLRDGQPQHYLVAIEAKVNACESTKQIERYQGALKNLVGLMRSKIGAANVSTVVCFLTRDGKAATSTCDSIGFEVVPLSYARILDVLIPVLSEHRNDPSAPFARWLLADVARDLADMHVGENLSIGAMERIIRTFATTNETEQ